MLGAGLLLSPVACSNASETSMPTTTTRASTSSAPVTMFALPGSLAADFTALRPSLDGHAGMAIMAVGGQRTAQMGDWTTGPSWSTMKVPLTLAVLRTNGNTSTYQMSAAITESDNSAADGLWQALGAPDAAAKAVQAVLREGGDTTTTVPATRSRAEYSAFGQADWSLADQVRWASRLPCLPDADTVTTLMGKVVWGQQWGLGHLDNTRFKGGWGPDPSGNYLVRQFGLLTTPNGDVAISLAAQATSGTFDDGTQILNKMAGLITKHLDDLPAGHCAPAQ
ncbi:hypothetical protein NOVA_16250 [Nocardia nova]|uniref:Serine hydrolase n=1 Tax=Nocardia nova TaxID=37330 RepID=A0A2S6A9P2_9NOCA|nr:hypothetical protein [Nocardia nova]PPI98535.1 hypothetical protein C5E46_12195 [Nocardia nova]PPJ30020.1 hypothetical protein C5F51_09665 [Nocardia nova]